MDASDDSGDLLITLESEWNKELSRSSLRNQKPALIKAFFRAFCRRFFWSTTAGAISFLVPPVAIYCITYAVRFLEQEDPSWYDAVWLCLLYISLGTLQFALR